MAQSLIKALKWFVIVVFIIGGFAAFVHADKHNDMTPVILAIFSFGVAYIMSYTWREFRDRVLLFNVVAVVGAGLAARILPKYIYIYAGYGDLLTWDIFLVWALFVFVLGVPFMTIVFHKYGE